MFGKKLLIDDKLLNSELSNSRLDKLIVPKKKN